MCKASAVTNYNLIMQSHLNCLHVNAPRNISYVLLFMNVTLMHTELAQVKLTGFSGTELLMNCVRKIFNNPSVFRY